MAFVLDASAAASLIFADESDPAAVVELFAAGETALVPTLFEWEIANLLATAMKRKRIDGTTVFAQLGRLARLPIEERAHRGRSWAVVELAAGQSLSAYDAGYLDLARTAGVPLATHDRRLARAAKAVGVELVLG